MRSRDCVLVQYLAAEGCLSVSKYGLMEAERLLRMSQLASSGFVLVPRAKIEVVCLRHRQDETRGAKLFQTIVSAASVGHRFARFPVTCWWADALCASVQYRKYRLKSVVGDAKDAMLRERKRKRDHGAIQMQRAARGFLARKLFEQMKYAPLRLTLPWFLVW